LGRSGDAGGVGAGEVCEDQVVEKGEVVVCIHAAQPRGCAALERGTHCLGDPGCRRVSRSEDLECRWIVRLGVTARILTTQATVRMNKVSQKTHRAANRVGQIVPLTELPATGKVKAPMSLITSI